MATKPTAPPMQSVIKGGITYRMVAHPSEWEDLVTELHRRKRSLDEFELSGMPQQLIGQGISPLRGSITITERESGTERTYVTGHGSKWVVDFVRDLDAGVFDVK